LPVSLVGKIERKRVERLAERKKNIRKLKKEDLWLTTRENKDDCW
jgi:hypothetical protein